MSFRFIRLLDQILGKILLLLVGPLCGLIARSLRVKPKEKPDTIAILKLHGGGSLLIALPMLLGLRAQYPDAKFTLIGTRETHKYAEITGLFDRYTLIDAGSLQGLIKSGFKTLTANLRPDIIIDLEPHSSLAAVFCPLTFAARRIGFVKAQEFYRAHCYTDAIYFNLHAPIHIFYEQIGGLLDATPATIETCREKLRAASDIAAPTLTPDHIRPALYLSAFASSLSTERMLPPNLWVEQLQKRFDNLPFTLILGGGPREAKLSRELAKQITDAMPAARILNVCGKRSMKQTLADIDGANEFWGIDSGPLHIARLLGKKCTSFWGPTNPAYLLNTIPGLEETTIYRAFPCSPCVHVSLTPPCKGDNQCMKQLFTPEISAPVWRL